MRLTTGKSIRKFQKKGIFLVLLAFLYAPPSYVLLNIKKDRCLKILNTKNRYIFLRLFQDDSARIRKSLVIDIFDEHIYVKYVVPCIASFFTGLPFPLIFTPIGLKTSAYTFHHRINTRSCYKSSYSRGLKRLFTIKKTTSIIPHIT